MKQTTIRVHVGAWAPVIHATPKPAKAPTVHFINKPGAPLELRKVKPIEPVSRLPGGLPPEPNRTPWRRVGDTGKVAREPFASKAVKGEFFATRRYLEGR